MIHFPHGPTLNGVYNELLRRWVAYGGMAAVAGTDHAQPECEDCGMDLTAQEVRESPLGWFCVDCDAANEEEGGVTLDYREDFHADG